MCLHALSLSNLHVLNMSFPSLWPHSDFNPCAIIYLSCQSSPLEFTRACNIAGMPYTYTRKWSRYGFTRKLHDDERLPEKRRTWEKKKRIVSFIWCNNGSQRGGMCCSRCGMAEKIEEERSVTKINSKAAVWKASLSSSLLNPYWHLKSWVQIGNGKKKKKNQDGV